MSLEKLLVEGAKELGVELGDTRIKKFITYLVLLKQWNNKLNLTSITDDREIVIKHFLDSLSILKILQTDSSILDIGSGGGFPGIPLAIAYPGLTVTLLDSSQKKVVFMKEVIRNLKLINANAVGGRAEDKCNNIKRNSFGFVVARAVSEINKVLDISLPYIDEKGKVFLMRGREGEKEWDSFVKRFVNNKNYDLSVELIKLKLPFSNYQRVVLIVGK